MNAHIGTRKMRHGVITVLLAVGAYSLVAAQPAVSGEGQPGSPTETRETCRGPVAQPDQTGVGEFAAGASGMLIHVDPKTGSLLKQPAPGTVPLQITPQMLNALSTSGKGLVELPSTVPGGGVRIDLQGRFMSPLFATIGSDGELRLHHLHEIPVTEGDK